VDASALADAKATIIAATPRSARPSRSLGTPDARWPNVVTVAEVAETAATAVARLAVEEETTQLVGEAGTSPERVAMASQTPGLHIEAEAKPNGKPHLNLAPCTPSPVPAPALDIKPMSLDHGSPELWRTGLGHVRAVVVSLCPFLQPRVARRSCSLRPAPDDWLSAWRCSVYGGLRPTGSAAFRPARALSFSQIVC
jgi:hypothetical protein